MSEKPVTPEITVNLLERRRIEAEILKYVYDAIKFDLGEEKAREIIGKAIQKAAQDSGEKAAQKEGGKTGTRSLAAIQHLWSAGGALSLKVTELTDNTYSYEVEHCAYARMYEEMGLKDLGLIFSCLRDSAYIEGYAPDLELERPKTIMEGDKVCVFRYRVRKEKGEE
jgi:predicted ArsR family transcriptional regulator